MDLREILHALRKEVDDVDDTLERATSYARDATNSAYEAKEQAKNAEYNTDEAIERLEEADNQLSGLRDLANELEERIEEIERNQAGEDDPDKPVGLSDLQKDMSKHKKKVITLKQRHPKITAKKIADHLGIGEFLVKHILETEGLSSKAA